MPTAKKRPPIDPNAGKGELLLERALSAPSFPAPVTEPLPSAEKKNLHKYQAPDDKNIRESAN